MSRSRLVSWAVFGLTVAAVGLWWRGGTPRSTLSKADLAPSGGVAADEAAADGVDATTLIVDYRDDITDQYLAETPEEEFPISRWSSVDRVYRVRFASAAAAAAAAERLRHDTHVESVDLDAQATIPPDETMDELAAAQNRSMQSECAADAAGEHKGFPNDACYRYQWHLRQVGLPAAWKMGRGEGVVVAVIDTGVSRVPDLAGTKFVPGYNFVADNDDAGDDHGHGTHVAGTIAQSTNNRLGVGGVAFGATIMPLKVLSARGSGSMAGIAQAIRYAADHGARVVNMSLGGPMPVGTIASAVKYARGKGVTVIAAAGNDGRGRVSYPARYPGVVAVAATQVDESTTFYSNWGDQIDIAAPGGNVRVDQNGDGKPDGVLQNTIVPGNTSTTDYLWFMGTSMASPHVAGVAALIVGAGVTKPDEVEAVLLGTARKPKPRVTDEAGASAGKTDGSRIDNHYGAGVADADAALKRVRTGRGLGELSLAAATAFLGLAGLGRRRRGGASLGVGFFVALLAGSSGLFVLPYLVPGSGAPGWMARAADIVGLGPLDMADAVLPVGWRGTPLIWSALLPVGLAGLAYGVRRLRPALAGLAFGIAGALLFAAVATPFDVRLVPNVLDRAWLALNAGVAGLLAMVIVRRGHVAD